MILKEYRGRRELLRGCIVSDIQISGIRHILSFVIVSACVAKTTCQI